MRRNIPVMVITLVCSCAAGSVAAQGASQGIQAEWTADTARTHGRAMESHDTINNAIAGPLIIVISQQLGGRAVDMRLDTVDVQDMDAQEVNAQEVNARDRVVSGTGSLRIDGNKDWVGFRFHLPYDARLGKAGYPEVTLGGVAAGERDVPNDAQLVQQLEARIVAALSKEFRQQSVWLQLDRIATVEGGSHYLGINADGIAHLGGDSTDMMIDAFYDRSSGEWLRLHYSLGEDAGYPSRNLSNN
jgi:hypothetical protein